MHDVIIIGAGPAGLSAAAWCDELGLETLVLEEASIAGGQLHRIYQPISNYLGLSTNNGTELAELFNERVDADEFDLWTDVQIEQFDARSRKISLTNGESLQSVFLVIATGVRRRSLGVPGEVELRGRGVAESGNRDRELLAGKDVCVVGGGDAAAENALLLAEVCPTVTMIHRGAKLSARKEFADRIAGDHRITLFRETVVTRIIGAESVEGVEVQRVGAIKPLQIAVQGVLIRIGVAPNTEWLGGQLGLDEHRYVIVDHLGQTDVVNVFAIGDVANPTAPTIAGAVGDGATVAKVIAARLKS